MTFNDIPTGETVFLDANVFIHYFGRDPEFGPPARDLLRRVENSELHAFTTTHILAEVSHRLMAIEAMQTLGWPYSGIAQRLRKHPEAVRSLILFVQCLREIHASPILITPLIPANLSDAAAVSLESGLLTNDAIVVAVMRQHQIRALASEDSDFDRISDLERFTAR